MDKYRIFETSPFLRDLRNLPPAEREFLRRKLDRFVYLRLRGEPHAGSQIRRLRDWSPPTWRYRMGRWRLFYEIDERDGLVLVTAIDRRRERTYRR